MFQHLSMCWARSSVSLKEQSTVGMITGLSLIRRRLTTIRKEMAISMVNSTHSHYHRQDKTRPVHMILVVNTQQTFDKEKDTANDSI